MFCRFCGKQLVEGSAFCSACGKAAAETATQMVSAYEPESADDWYDENDETPVRGKGSLIAGIVTALVLLLLVVGCVGGTIYQNSHVPKAEDTVVAFFDDFNEQNYTGMMKYMDEDFQNRVDNISNIAGAAGKAILGFEIPSGVLSGVLSFVGDAVDEVVDIEYPQVEIEVLEVRYSGSDAAEFFAGLPVDFLGLGKSLATEAAVEVQMNIDGEITTEEITLTKNQEGEWKIDSDNIEKIYK